MRRVVVTGLGAITPLGVGIRRTWDRLLAGHCGIVSTANFEPSSQWRELPSNIAGVVPEGSKEDSKWQASDWLEKGEERRMAKFTQFAIAATEMALEDAGWKPINQDDKEATGVCLGSGIGNLEELYTTSVAYDKTVSDHGSRMSRVAETHHRVIRKSLHFLFRNFSSTLELAIFQ